MDKNEYQLKLEEMKNLYAEQDYAAAAAIADTINWRRVRNVNTLCMVGDIYDQQKRYKESRAVLLMAYDKSPVGKNIVYKLASVAIKYSTYEEAKEFCDEFGEIAPHDNRRYILKYKLAEKGKAPLGDRIAILEDLKEHDYTEEWAYELAELYFKANLKDKCSEACDELIIWFGDGIYVKKAKELKRACQPLITAQGKVHVADIQEELSRRIDQVADAPDKEAVNSVMGGIQRMLAEIPALQFNLQTLAANFAWTGEDGIEIESDEDIDRSLAANFNEMIGEEADGQMSLRTGQYGQVNGQLEIEDVLREWEYTKRVAEAALADADVRKLQSAKARAIQEIEGLIQLLNEVPPVLELPEIREPEPEQSIEEIEEAVLAETDDSEELQDASKDSVKEIAEVVSGQVTEDQTDEYVQDEDQEIVDLARQKEEEAMAELHDSVIAQATVASNKQISKLDRASAGIDRMLKGGAHKVAGTMDSLLDMMHRKPQEPEEAEVELPEIELPEDMREVAEEPVAESEPETEIPVVEAVPEPELVAEPETEVPVEEPAEEPEAEVPVEEPAKEPEATVPVEEPEPESAVQPENRPEIRPEVRPEPVMEEPVKGTIVRPLAKASEEQIKGRTDRSRVSQNTARIHLQMTGRLPDIGIRLAPEQRDIFTYFLAVPGMEEQIAKTLENAKARGSSDCTSSSGNIVIQGASGSGKTVLATNLIKAMGKRNGKIGKIQAKTLNRKNPQEIVSKVKGGYLIIENAGELNAQTAGALAQAMIGNTGGMTMILEDTKYGIRQALALNDAFTRKFTEKINIPIFTIDELVIFAKAYAKEMECVIDELGVLALYNRINNIQKREEATTLMEVKDIVDAAIDSAERGNRRKLFGKRFDEDDNLILHEKDFEI